MYLAMAELGLVISHLFAHSTPTLERLVTEARVLSFRQIPEPSWLAWRPVRRILHWGLGPVLADFNKEFVRQGLGRYLSETEVELFSFDLGPAARSHCGLLPLSKTLSPSVIYRQTEACLKFIRRFYSGPLGVENYNYYPTGLYEHVTEPCFIENYLKEFDLGLVLDLAHGAVTAHNLGLRPQDYFNSLPLGKVVELHLSRPWLPSQQEFWAVDSHGLPGQREWDWLKKLLDSQRLSSKVLVFIEYYTRPDKLGDAQKVLATLLNQIEPNPLKI